MKQLNICLCFTVFIHILFSILGSNWNPFEWILYFRALYVSLQILIWFVPITLNYLNGNENFE